MSKRLYSRSLAALFILVWILTSLHLYKGVKEIIANGLTITQRTIISLQLTFEVAVFIEINLLIISSKHVLDRKLPVLNNFDQSYVRDIDIFIPIRRVIPDLLEQTLQGFQEVDYPKEKIHVFVADDTPEKEMSDIYKSLCDRYNVKYVYEPSNILFKAGMLNIAFDSGNSEFVAFFDHDQIPMKNVLKEFMTAFNQFPDIDYVQSKKIFRNLDNVFKVWSAMLYALYFEVFERNKFWNDVVLFAGSTACFRRSVINKLGGFPETTFTEDNSLSVEMILNGHKGYYIDRAGSMGTVPPTFPLQISQLWRWSHGASNVLNQKMLPILTSRKLKLGQKLDIIGTFGISPMVVVVYIYGLSFIPLINEGVDSKRFVVHGFSSIIFIPILAALTYSLLALTAMVMSKEEEESEIKYSNLPGFLIIALASNLLIITSGIFGIFGIFGPKSKSGRWTREIHITRLAVCGFVIGCGFLYFGIKYFLLGFASASLFILLSITLIPSIFIVFYSRLQYKDAHANIYY